MLQNGIRLGDVYNFDTEQWSSDEGFPQLRELAWDIETTTLDPLAPNAHVLTITAILSTFDAAHKTVQKAWVLQLGSVREDAEEWTQWRKEHPDVELEIKTFGSGDFIELSEGVVPTLENRFLWSGGAELSLIRAFDDIVQIADPDLLSVSKNI